MKIKNTFLFSLVTTLFIASLVATGILYFKLKNIKQPLTMIIDNKTIESFEKIPTTTTENNTLPVTETVRQDAFGKYTENADGIKNYTQNFSDSGLDVEWNGKAIPVSEKDADALLAKIFPDYLKIKKGITAINNSATCKAGLNHIPSTCAIQDPNIYLYSVGKIKNIDSVELYYIFVPDMYEYSMGDMTAVVLGFLDPKTRKFIAIINPSITEQFEGAIEMIAYGLGDAQVGDFIIEDDIKKLSSKTSDFPIFSGYIAYKFKELADPPTVLDIPGTNLKITSVTETSVMGYDYIYNYLDNSDDAGISNPYKQEVETEKFNQLPIAFQTKDGIDVHRDDQCYYIIKPNGTVLRYNMVPAFMSWEREAQKIYYGDYLAADITWNDGPKNEDTYIITGEHTGGGCNGPRLSVCTNVVNNKAWFDQGELVRTGTGKNGEKIFEMKNAKDNEFYKEIFYKVFLPDEKTQFFADFIKDHPLFFWQDHLGNWRVFQKTKYQPQAECGKPVIYLYPTKDMDVKVEVKPNGGFTKTEPLYGNGWFVHATTQSDLFNYADKTNYPYLFWEGKAYDYVAPNYGFVMSKTDVGVKMPQILAKLGLNEKETKDFLEFWQPKLEVKPFVFVTFLPQREFDKLAPLTVNPKPGTVIRVFMDYTPLDAPMKVVEPRFRTPERIGFTVVEWGGRLR